MSDRSSFYCHVHNLRPSKNKIMIFKQWRVDSPKVHPHLMFWRIIFQHWIVIICKIACISFWKTWSIHLFEKCQRKNEIKMKVVLQNEPKEINLHPNVLEHFGVSYVSFVPFWFFCGDGDLYKQSTCVFVNF